MKRSGVEYCAILNSIPHGIVEINIEGKISFYNEAFVKILNIDKSSIISGEKVWDLFENNTQKIWIEKFIKNSFKKRSVQEIQEIQVNQGESIIFLQVVSTPVIDPDLDKNSIILTFTDVTAQKQAEISVLKSKTNLKAMFDSSPLIYFLIDLSFEVITFNKKAKIFVQDYYQAELNQNNIFLKFLDSDSKKEFKDHFKACLKGEKINFEKSMYLPLSKEGRCFEYSFLPVYDSDNQFFAVAITILDITEKKKAEQTINENREKFRALFNTADDFIFIKNTKCEYTTLNPAMQRLFNLNEDSLIGKTDFDLIDKISAEHTFITDKIVLEGKPIDEELTETFNNTTKSFHIIKGPLRDSAGNINGIFGIARDITARKESEKKIKQYMQELKELNSTKDKFFSIIGHDLKNPISQILGFSELILNNVKTYSPEKTEKYMRLIYNSTEHAYNLLTNLLDWSRSQSNRIKFDPREVDLYQLVTDGMEVLENNAKYKNIQIYQLVSPNTFLWCDANMITTVIRNLLSNAIKYTPQGGSIRIFAYDEEDTYIVSIKDSGVGIKTTDFDKLFKFNQNKSTLGTDREKGTGLGLIICKEFVEKHKGKIWISSELGQGTHVQFSLPKKK